jgi:hypothetical protein
MGHGRGLTARSACHGCGHDSCGEGTGLTSGARESAREHAGEQANRR